MNSSPPNSNSLSPNTIIHILLISIKHKKFFLSSTLRAILEELVADKEAEILCEATFSSLYTLVLYDGFQPISLWEDFELLQYIFENEDYLNQLVNLDFHNTFLNSISSIDFLYLLDYYNYRTSLT